ncbi:Mycolic acid cyclopropane synthetase-domain-containing protein [Xylariales sp. PMI_506]|nr:Mycolic acid cyclopropane synthetase-domain-containing protein [Xylariales sp. PMI_506]
MFEKQTGRFARAALFSMLEKIEYGRLHIKVVRDDDMDGKNSELFTFGKEEKPSHEPEATLVVKSPSVWLRLCSNLDAGFAESYMLREIETDSLLDLFLIYINSSTVLGNGNFIFQLLPALFRLIKPTNDPARALRNASFHYDTSNDLFAGFLSPDMNYSSPIWLASEPEESLESAQMRKIHHLIDKLELSPEHHLLDIGGGWGSLAITAAQSKGCRVTTTTLSKEQKELCDLRIKNAGVQDRVDCVIRDYRKSPLQKGGYDRIVSVEMVEHVGKEHMNEYFGAISRLLKPTGGIMVVQGITIINQFYKLHANVDNFIERYIFPGGYLPTAAKLLNAVDVGSNGELEVESVESIGHHYCKALRLWRENFVVNWPQICASYKKSHPLSEVETEAFRRRWIYYFTYCEAGFRSGILTDHIIKAVRRPVDSSSFGTPL